MIAPRASPDSKAARRHRRFRHARRLVASTLFPPAPEASEQDTPVAAWKAWLFVAWLVIVVVFYFACMMKY